MAKQKNEKPANATRPLGPFPGPPLVDPPLTEPDEPSRDDNGDDFPLVNFDGNERKSKFTNFVASWSTCRLCPLSTTRNNVVFVRGSLPCDVLFLGHAPRHADDKSGLPLSGPSGKLLDKLINDTLAKGDGKSSLSYCIALTIGCVPWGCGDVMLYRSPTLVEEKACLPRLVSLLELAEPRSLIFLGDDVKQYWTRNEAYFREYVTKLPGSGTIARIPTPAAIIAKGGTSEGNDVYREARSTLRQILLNRVAGKPR